MEKIVKFNELLANCLIFHRSVDMMRVLNQLQREGHAIDPADVATLSPYLTRHIRRFGDYELDLSPPADLPEAHLELNGGSGGPGGSRLRVLQGSSEA
jgi:hypothetical protein